MRPGTCVHFTGTLNQTCKAGVNYRDHVGGSDFGWGLRLPCLADKNKTVFKNYAPPDLSGRVPCDKYQEVTSAQLAAFEQEAQAVESRIAMTFPLCRRIKNEHKGKNWQGVEECPVCKGRLHLGHSGDNGHVSGRCETSGCVAWME